MEFQSRPLRFPDDAAAGGIYVHVPFCKGRCSYCGFVSNPYDRLRASEYATLLATEAALRTTSASFDTVYFGGGTPALLGPEGLETVLEAVSRSFPGTAAVETTIEINPGSACLEDFSRYRALGINRASLGIQSMNDSLLRKMGRIHDAARNRAAFKELRIAGFDNISVDIIAGYPEQTCEDLGRSLLEVLEWRPEHISLYLLEVKPDTPLCERIAQGRVAAPDDDLQAEMYEMVCEQIGSNGYIQYEISNFSLPGYESRHNLKYWTDRVFMGLGSAAHGMTGQVRYINHERLTEYEAALRSRCLPEQRIAFSPEIRFREALIMGLRLTGGLDLRALGLRYEIDAETFVRTTVGQFEDAGLLCFDHGRVMLTPRGRLLSNLVFSAWV